MRRGRMTSEAKRSASPLSRRKAALAREICVEIKGSRGGGLGTEYQDLRYETLGYCLTLAFSCERLSPRRRSR